MEIAHLQTLSLLDYPGKVSAVLWTVGCNLRCPFCYNAELVLPELSAVLPRLAVPAVLARLGERVKLLDGVVVTGGEPTLHPDLPLFLAEVRSLGLLVKLDTNGTRPEALRSLLEAGLVNYVALDLKAPLPRYPEFTGFPPSPVGARLGSNGGLGEEPSSDAVARVRESVALVRDLAPDHEFRTTVAPGLTPDDLIVIASEIRGARRYALQPFFVPEGKPLVDERCRGRSALAPDALRALLPELQKLVPTELRA